MGTGGSGGGASGTGGSGGGAGGAAGSSDAVVGVFSVRLDPQKGEVPAFTSIIGVVKDGPQPVGTIMTAIQQADGCALRTPSVPFCDPACAAGTLCTGPNRCDRYPTAVELGAVTVKGLGPAPFTMQAIAGNYQPPIDLVLPHPPFAEGAEVRFETAGGAYAPIALVGKGIAPLALAGSGAIPLVADQPLKLQWTPPGNATVSRIHVRVDISHHGGLKGEIECDVADSGAMEVPATMVTKLLALGTAGFPTVYVTRLSTATAAIPPGRVVLEISSPVDRPLDIPGVVSCSTDTECGSGKTCRADRTCG